MESSVWRADDDPFFARSCGEPGNDELNSEGPDDDLMEPLATVMVRARGEPGSFERPEHFNAEGSDDDARKCPPLSRDMLARGCEELGKVEGPDNPFFVFCRGDIPEDVESNVWWADEGLFFAFCSGDSNVPEANDTLLGVSTDTASSRTVETRDRNEGL